MNIKNEHTNESYTLYTWIYKHNKPIKGHFNKLVYITSFQRNLNLQLFSSNLMLLIKQRQFKVHSFIHHTHQWCAYHRLI
jgi:hypothetical protein